MKVLIENTVPLNNGDAALIFGLGNELKEIGMQVVYSTDQKEISKELYGDEEWIESPLKSKISRLPFVGYVYLVCKILANYKLYSNIDYIISAPGGYVNSYYKLSKHRLKLLLMYKTIFRKKVYIYSQSFGPFNEQDATYIKRVLPKLNLVYARDDVSKERLDNLKIEENVVQTKDAAFLLPRIEKKSKITKSVAISVRDWKFDNRSREVYFSLIKKIAEFFINNDYKIVFISTCQGIDGYIDDSKIAKQIVDHFDEQMTQCVTIDSNYYNLNQLRDALLNFDYVVGTRLHMCILSLLSSVPAFNISYEEKGKESYKYLGLQNYSVDYNFEGEIETKLEQFILEDYTELFKKIDDINKESKVHLRFLLSK